MLPTIYYVFLTAWRDKMFWALLVGILATSLVAHMLGATAPADTEALTLSYSSSAARVMIVIGLIIFTCSHLHNAFSNQEVDVFLSRPITRANLVFAYWIGFANVALFHAAAVVLLIAFQGAPYWHGFLWWSISLLAECWLVVAISLFASFTLKSGSFSILASMAFYFMARMMGYFIATTNSGFLFEQHWINLILTNALKGVSIIMPRLDFFAKDEWLTHGIGHLSDITLFMAQAAIFVPLLIFATIADFRRRQF